jgi:hypothetical protein
LILVYIYFNQLRMEMGKEKKQAPISNG